jgi:hypothetical protein
MICPLHQQQYLKVADALWPIREDYISLLTDSESLEEKEIDDREKSLKRQLLKFMKAQFRLMRGVMQKPRSN